MMNITRLEKALLAGFVSSFGLIAASADIPVKTKHRNDRQALAGDWQNIGGDFRKAVKKTSTAR
ncbi:hypothetical protein EGK75_07385 [Neisseria weixii]|uniref:Uncharacterized protein n=2 Tax=Neisseria weixii TaxID=1853276 RepID=A0A3N4N4F1_9NEIS|nr:hypothetical protein EGK74_08100 [Neisseria weixii]RPD87182.1 hypothetical protein EGK75_07385 [Neisseria weixii]